MLITVKTLAEEAGWAVETVYEFAARKSDPLPVRYLPGRKRRGVVIEGEFREWMERNSTLYSERFG